MKMKIMMTILPTLKSIVKHAIPGNQVSPSEAGNLCEQTLRGHSDAAQKLFGISAISIVQCVDNVFKIGFSRSYENDLCQEAFMGVIRAAKGFDASLGFRFHTYSKMFIKMQVNRFFYKNMKLISPPQNQDFQKAFFSLSQLKKRGIVSPRNVATHLNIAEPIAARAIDYSTIHADHVENDDLFGITKTDVEQYHQTATAFEKVETVLSDKEKTAIVMNVCMDVSEANVGDEIGVSREQVRRLKKFGFSKLQKVL